jgi:hypothetical protein
MEAAGQLDFVRHHYHPVNFMSISNYRNINEK